jgi:predicted MPP superfamily phosphohydrolase
MGLGTVWLRRWLIALNVGLLGLAVVLGTWVTRRAVFLAALVPIAVMPFSYARLRLHRLLARHAGAAPGARRALGAFAAAAVLCDAVMVAQLLTARAPTASWPLQAPGIGWIGPVWFSAYALLFVGWLLLDAGRSLARGVRRGVALVRALRPPPPAEAPDTAEAATLPRREFLQRSVLASAALPFAVSLSGVSLSYDFRVEEREVEVPGWPRALDGLRVVHLSDIHVGGAMNRERLRRMAELANGARPDLVAHTGDFLTHRSGDFDTPLYEALARIHAPHGQWACLGNHDFDDPDRLVRRLGDAGVAVLRGRLVRLGVGGAPLEVAGVDFPFARDPAAYARPVARLGGRGEAPRLLLDHDPRAFAALPAGSADLVLSGHTHGGHVGIQLGPSHAITVVGLLGIPDQGLFDRPGMRLFVTRCVGFYGYPMRIGIPPEIAVLVLRAPRAAGGRSSTPS